MDNLLVFDASHLTYRSYHAGKFLAENSNSNIEDVAIYLFMNSVLSMIKKFSNRKVIFLYDKAGSTESRKDLNENYKANRVFNPVVHNIKTKLITNLKLMNFNVIEADGYEADDLAYWMSRNLKNDIVFISEDKDWISYVTYNSVLYRPIKKVLIKFSNIVDQYKPIRDSIIKASKDYKETPIAKLDHLESLHLLLSQRKVLLGDASDNIKGFKGIGPKSVPEVLVRLNSVKDYKEFSSRTTAQKNLKLNIDQFITNLKILGYEGLKDKNLMVHFCTDELTNDSHKYYLELCDEINSKDLRSKYESISNILPKDNHVELQLKI